MNTLDKFLEHYNLTRYQLSKASGLVDMKLVRANRQPISQIKVEIIQAIAKEVDKSAGQVLDEMLKIEALE